MSEEQRHAALGDFLRTRRAHMSPAQLGFPAGVRRRTPGLRREEVAVAAGVSTTWYTYLEQGRDIRVSRSVLENIADALRLTRDERLHLALLADQPLPAGAPSINDTVRPVYRWILDALGESPAYITGRRTDLVAWNRAATVTFGDFGAMPERERNLLWLLFTDTAFRRLFVDWGTIAKDILESFRATAAHYMSDPCITDFIDALGRASPEFRRHWARHNVRGRCAEWREIAHPTAGRLALELAGLQVSGDPDVKCCVYVAAPGSETAAKLRQLVESATPSTNAQGGEDVIAGT